MVSAVISVLKIPSYDVMPYSVSTSSTAICIIYPLTSITEKDSMDLVKGETMDWTEQFVV